MIFTELLVISGLLYFIYEIYHFVSALVARITINTQFSSNYPFVTNESERILESISLINLHLINFQ
ncbi:hypothetical protein HNQ41_000555 [Texcoconibacillus texcoconensis]|uniref:Uncharacterized protein n=1 Tax=Texcoconibacillus texcoconensis TaxID=1095777 RepID=A0A840QM40_9BACI|nr:hypothetical protein [Texcoconibacillus texcoconensis]